MSTIGDLARELATKYGDDLDEALRVVTSYANDLDVDTGTQSGGQAPNVDLDPDDAAVIYRAYEIARDLEEGGPSALTSNQIRDILDRLNGYTGGNIWQDVILHLDIDEGRTDEADPASANDLVVLADGTLIAYDHQRKEWTTP